MVEDYRMIKYIKFKLIRLGCFLGLVKEVKHSPELLQEGMNKIFDEEYRKWKLDRSRYVVHSEGWADKRGMFNGNEIDD